jgi:hypothetical protein
MDLGDGGPDGSALLPVSVTEIFGRLRREFLGLAVVSWAVHLHSSCLVLSGTGVIPQEKADMRKPGQRVAGLSMNTQDRETSTPRGLRSQRYRAASVNSMLAK